LVVPRCHPGQRLWPEGLALWRAVTAVVAGFARSVGTFIIAPAPIDRKMLSLTDSIVAAKNIMLPRKTTACGKLQAARCSPSFPKAGRNGLLNWDIATGLSRTKMTFAMLAERPLLICVLT